MNKLLSDPQPSPRLANMGFHYNPFTWRHAEMMRSDVLEETYTPHPRFKETIMDLGRSTVLLAPFGGGKTAGRLRLMVEIDKKQQDAVKNIRRGKKNFSIPLVVDYINFEGLVNQLPAITLENHKLALLARIAEAFYKFICSYDDLFLRIPIRSRDFWWAFMEEFRLGISSFSDLSISALLNDWQRNQSRKSPFVEGTTLTDIINILVSQLKELNITPLFIFVDGVDAQTQDQLSLEAIPLPLLNHLGLVSIEGVLWKFFLPNSLNGMVNQSLSYRSGRLDILPIKWNQDSLKRFLHERLLWASDGEIGDVTQNCAQDVLMKLGDVDSKLSQMALQHARLGPPRALLELTNMLYHCGDQSQITLHDWDYFAAQVQQDLDVEDIYRSMVVAIRDKEGKVRGTGFLTTFGEQTYVITCAHVMYDMQKKEGDSVDLSCMESSNRNFEGKIIWYRPTKEKAPNEWSAFDDVCVILPSPESPEISTLRLSGVEDEYEDILGCWCFGYLASKNTRGDWFKDITSERRVGDDFVRLSHRGAVQIDKGVSGAPVYSPHSGKIIGIIQAVFGKEVAYLIPGYVIQDVLQIITNAS